MERQHWEKITTKFRMECTYFTRCYISKNAQLNPRKEPHTPQVEWKKAQLQQQGRQIEKLPLYFPHLRGKEEIELAEKRRAKYFR
jgi:ribosomal protein S16